MPPEPSTTEVEKSILQADLANTLADARDVRTTKVLAEALREVFGENQEAQRFIDVQRIPLICKSIFDIHANITDIKDLMKEMPDKFVSKDEFWPYKVAGGALIVAVVGALVAFFAKS